MSEVSRMRTLFRITVACLLWMHAAAAFADCTRPRPTFSIPEGGSASQQDLTAANSALTDFGGKVRDYLNCMNGEMSQKAVGKDAAAREEINKAHAAAYNAAAANQVGGGGTPTTTELTVEASGHTFDVAGGGKWLYYLARDIRSRRCSAQEAAEECLYRAVHVRNDSDEVLECKGEISYVGTDSRGQKTATGQLLVSGRGSYVLVESLAKHGVDAETFEAKCTARAKLATLDTPANCKYEVVKPITISDYYPPASRDAGEEGPVIVEFTLSGKAERPTEVRTVASSMYPRLDEAAVKAVGDMVMSSSCGQARFRLKLSFLLQQ